MHVVSTVGGTLCVCVPFLFLSSCLPTPTYEGFTQHPSVLDQRLDWLGGIGSAWQQVLISADSGRLQLDDLTSLFGCLVELQV